MSRKKKPAKAGASQLSQLSALRRLAAAAAGLTLLGFLLFLGAGRQPWDPVLAQDLLPPAIFLAVVALALLLLVASGYRGDAALPGGVLLLSGFGVLAQVRMGSLDISEGFSPGDFAFPIGIALMLAAALVFRGKRFKQLERFHLLFGVMSLAGIAAMTLLGNRYRGGVYAPGLFTPTEFIKVPMVIFLAAYMARRLKALQDVGLGGLGLPLRSLLPLGIFWAALAALLVLQRDLGMFAILTAVLLTMLYLGTNRISYLVYALLGSAAFGALAFRFLMHGQRRLEAWRNPFEDPTGSGWQILQGLSGLFAGGLWGAGFGEGQPKRIPIAASDFIYAAVGEELGYIGCLLLVLLYIGLFRRGYLAAAQAKDAFARFLTAGLISILAAQAFLNLGGVTKLIPLTGIPLPFVSHGGSSLISGFIAIGLIMAVSQSTGNTSGRSAARRKPRSSSAEGNPPRR